MKISDLNRVEKVNEGFIEDIANIYKNTNYGKQKQLEKNEKAAYDYGLKSFIPQINRDLAHAIDSGFVQLSPIRSSSTSKSSSSKSSSNQRVEPTMKSATPAAPAVTNSWPPASTAPAPTAAPTPAPAPTAAPTSAPASTPATTQPVYINGKKLDPNNPNDAVVLAKLQAQQSSKKTSKKITNEAAQQQTISQWIQQYMRTQTNKLASSPLYQSHVDEMAQSIEKRYARTRKITNDDAKQLWDILWAWSKVGDTGRNNYSNNSNYGSGDSSYSTDENSIQNTIKVASAALRNLSRMSDDQITANSESIKKIIDALTKVIA